MQLTMQSTLVTLCFFTFSCGVREAKSTTTAYDSNLRSTVDIGKSLEEILEYDNIRTACDEYWGLLGENDEPQSAALSPTVRELEVRCGKWLFIGWETSGKMPLPEILFDAIERSWPERVGKNFEKLGFLPNPADPAGRPLGIARSTTRYTGMPSVNVTCAACHIGQLPDGRYAVGAPNTKLHLSEFNLMSYYPLYAAMHKDERRVLPAEIKNYYEELVRTERRRIWGGNYGIDWSNVVFKYSKLLHWLNIGSKGLPDAQFVAMPPDRDLRSWLSGRPGVFNPGAPMLTLQIEDVPNLSVPHLWGITGFEEDYQAGRAAPLGQTTKYASLEKFVSSAFVYSYQDLSLVRPRYVRPIVSYIRQLQSPLTPEVQSQLQVESGAKIFNRECSTCHDGSAGESTRLYDSKTVGTHPSLESPRDNYVATTPIAKLINDLSAQLAAELKPQPRGVRSRRLKGVWSRTDLMIDGSIEDLPDLFCIGDKRKINTSPHQELCDSHTHEEKLSLISYLKSL